MTTLPEITWNQEPNNGQVGLFGAATKLNVRFVTTAPMRVAIKQLPADGVCCGGTVEKNGCHKLLVA